jgi:nitroreductase
MTYPFVPYRPLRRPPEDMAARAEAFFGLMDSRRSVRSFSSEAVPRDLIETAIATASTAPSGAHRQPWRFVLVGDAETKSEIRQAAEAEERENYEGGRLPPDWIEALGPLGTDWHKPFLEEAPWLVVVFEERYGIAPDGSRRHNYYVKESVGIACGLFIAAIHNMGLATLTHTPSPMRFLTSLLGRPDNERPFVLFPVGYPAPDCQVPDLERKALDEVLVEHA